VLSERTGRLRDIALFLALALLPSLAVGVLGLRALQGEESAQRRVALAALQASAERTRELAEQRVAAADAALLAAVFDAELPKAQKTLEQITPPFALPVVLDRGRELLLPAATTNASTTPATNQKDCDEQRKLALAETDPTRRRTARKAALLLCTEATGPEGRFVFPVLALADLSAEEAPLLVDWLGSHAALLSAGERGATAEEIRASKVFDPVLAARGLALLSASPEARGQVLSALRSEACANALRQGPDRVGMMRFRAPDGLGVFRALDPNKDGRLVGFIVSRESLGLSLTQGAFELPPEHRFGVSLSPGLSAARVSLVGASELEIVVTDRDPLLINRRASKSRLLLGVMGVGAVLISLALLLLLWARVQRARRTSELRVDFVSALSHELRTPASSVRMFADLLAAGHVEKDEQQEVFVALLQESKRLGDTIERMLSFGRMAKGKLVAKREWQKVGPIVEQATDEFEKRFRDKPAVLREIDGDAEAPVDAGLLRLAVDNLLDNAHKYAPSGTPYRVVVREEASRVVVEVSDRGPGIAKRDQRRIFAPFERLDDKLSRETEGSGLGLSLVAAVLLAHGGDVRVESELGQGATFVLVFVKPKYKNEASPQASREDA